MNRRRSYVAYAIVIVSIVVLFLQLDFTELKNRISPNTTFTKEVIEKIGNHEVTSIKLIPLIGNTTENTLDLKNKEDRDRILNSLAPLKLKRVNKLSDTSIETYFIILRNQVERTFGIILYDTNDMLITNYKNSSIQYYKITNDLDLDEIKKVLEDKK